MRGKGVYISRQFAHFPTFAGSVGEHTPPMGPHSLRRRLSPLAPRSFGAASRSSLMSSRLASGSKLPSEFFSNLDKSCLRFGFIT